MADALEVKRRSESRLFSIPGVHSVGFGAKVTAGKPVGEFAIIVEVEKKKVPAEIPSVELVPREIDGVKTDVVERAAGAVRHSVLQGGDRIDAEYPGLSSDGTLGCIARLNVPDTSPPDVLLSNHHVLYLDEATPPGADVTVPSCSNCCHEKIATVLDGPKINTDIDAALAKFDAGVQTKAQIHNVPVKGILDLLDPHLPPDIQTALQNQTFRVHKYGYKTNLTHGRILSIDHTITNILPSSHQIEIQPIDRGSFDEEGDSGSVVYDDSNRIVGLLWGGSADSTVSFACHISKVLAGFPGLRIATNPPEVIYRTPGIRRLPPALERVHRDLVAAGCIDYYAGLYGKHHEEVAWLLAHSRRFVSAWHRNHGPTMVRSLTNLIEDRVASLPENLEGLVWKDCVQKIANALLCVGSQQLQDDVRYYLSCVTALGGSSYANLLQLLRSWAVLPN